MITQRRENSKNRFWTRANQFLKLKVSKRLVSDPLRGVRAAAKRCTEKQMVALGGDENIRVLRSPVSSTHLKYLHATHLPSS